MLRKRSSMRVPRLQLTLHDEHELRELARDLEREVVDAYEQFLFRHRRRVDTTRWKLTRSHEDLHVYCERDDYRKTWRHESKMREFAGPMAELSVLSSVPLLFATGSVQGTLDDALLGHAFLNTASLRVRDAYLAQKAVDDTTLLAVVDAPDSHDPFAFLGVVHSTRKSAVAMGRPRDLLLLEGARASTLSTGERIGVVFHHSITHDALPENWDADSHSVRAGASMVAIYRQLDESRVDVFVMDFCDLRGKTPAHSALRQSIALLVPRVGDCVDAAVRKKLYWLMCERQRGADAQDEEEKRRRDRGLSDFSCMSEPRVDVDFCDICDASLRRAASKLGAYSSCLCQLCGLNVCGRCVVSKRIAIDASTPQVEQKPFAFCVACVHSAKTHAASTVARRTLEQLYARSVRQGSKGTPHILDDDYEHSRPTTLID